MHDLNNKVRLIEIIKILEEKTDYENEISVNDIINELKKEYGYNIKINRRTINDDLRTLVDCDDKYEQSIGNNNENMYSYKYRLFEHYELRILLDAISSARFITENDSTRLIDKIKKLTSEKQAEKLQSKIFKDKIIVCEDSGLRYNIDKLHTATQERKLIKFKYGNYTVEKNFVLHHEGAYYFAEPYGVVWNNNFYYLVGKNRKYNKLINYRIDRMRNVEVEEKRFNRKPAFNMKQHISECFNMYPGKVKMIWIRFDNHLINAIIDRFGNDVRIDKDNNDDSKFILKTHAAMNKGLVRWVLNWGSDAEVLQPYELKEEIKIEIEKMSSIYNK